MPVLLILAAALALALTAGCNFAPEYTRPDLPVANEYPADASAPTPAKPDARTAADIAWRDYFTDPQLQTVIEQALEHNRDLRVAVLRVLEARAGFQIRRSDQFPTLDANAAAMRARIPENLSVTRGAFEEDLYDVGVSVSAWEIDFWGRVRNLKGAALEQFLSSDAARRAANLSLIA